MDFKVCMNNFPWNRFGTVYETNSKELRDKFIKIFDGNADTKDYQFIIDRLEHQATLYRITPWGLKFYIYLLEIEKSDKSTLLENIKTIFEAANYNSKGDIAQKYKPTKGNLEKYEQIKIKLFDDSFDGKLDTEYIKAFKAIDRHFMQISIMDYILSKKLILEKLIKSNDPKIIDSANLLVNSINNPRKYKFTSEDGVEEEY